MATLFLVLACLAQMGHAQEAYRTPGVAVGPQYDSTHVYVAPKDLHHFVASFMATFGGSGSKESIVTVTPAPSRTRAQLVFTPVFTPVGILSVFGYKTPIP